MPRFMRISDSKPSTSVLVGIVGTRRVEIRVSQLLRNSGTMSVYLFSNMSQIYG